MMFSCSALLAGHGLTYNEAWRCIWMGVDGDLDGFVCVSGTWFVLVWQDTSFRIYEFYNNVLLHGWLGIGLDTCLMSDRFHVALLFANGFVMLDTYSSIRIRCFDARLAISIRSS
jgi:hypothetical protein